MFKADLPVSPSQLRRHDAHGRSSVALFSEEAGALGKPWVLSRQNIQELLGSSFCFLSSETSLLHPISTKPPPPAPEAVHPAAEVLVLLSGYCGQTDSGLKSCFLNVWVE